jgi:hypothetical protein
VVHLNKPALRVSYELKEREAGLLAQTLERHLPDRRRE